MKFLRSAAWMIFLNKTTITLLENVYRLETKQIYLFQSFMSHDLWTPVVRSGFSNNPTLSQINTVSRINLYLLSSARMYALVFLEIPFILKF